MSSRPKRQRTAASRFDDSDYSALPAPSRPSAKRTHTGRCGIRAAEGAEPCTKPAVAGKGTCDYHAPRPLAGVPVDFPDNPPNSQLRFLAECWRAKFRNDRWVQLACAVCGVAHNADEIKTISRGDLTPSWLEPLLLPAGFLPLLRRSKSHERDLLFTYADPLIDQHILDRAGIVYVQDEFGQLQGCRTRATSLDAGQMPTLSLANGLWVGPVPPELASLTPAEEIVIALARTSQVAIFFLDAPDRRDPEARQRASKGHWLGWPQFTDQVYEAVTSIPMPASDLSDVLHVTLIGTGEHNPSSLKRAVGVSISRVRAAFEWLVAHNPLYAAVTWNAHAATTYGKDGEVPTSISVTVYDDKDGDLGGADYYEGAAPDFGVKDREAFERSFETLGEVEQFLTMEEDPLGAFDMYRDPFEGDEITTSGMMEVDERQVPSEAIRSNGVRNTLAEGSKQHVLVGRAACFESSYDTELLPRTFPKLFPYGVGGFVPRSGARVPSASGTAPDLQYHHRAYLTSFDRRFATHRTYPFFVRDLHHRRTVAQRCALKISRRGGRAEDLLNVVEDDLVALDRIVQRAPIGPRPESVKRAELLLRYCQWVLQPIVGLEHSRLNSRNHIRAMITAFGSPAIWITISPSDSQSKLLLKLDHVEINLDLGADQQPRPPSLRDRRRTAARNPVANAQAFRATMDAVFDILVGPTRDGLQQGIFGRALAHYATIEAGKRGFLHAHGLIWLHGLPSPDVMAAKLQDPSFAARVIDYVDNVLAHDFGAGRSWREDAQAEGVVVDKEVVLLDNAPSMLGESSDVWRKAMEDDRTAVGRIVQHHRCSANCKRKGECRYRFPKEIVPSTTVSADGTIEPRQLDPRTNGHNPILTSLVRCNTDLKLVFLRPALTLNFVFYSTKYMTKSDLAVRRMTALTRMAAKTAAEYRDPSKPKAKQAQALLNRCCRRIAADADVPAAACCYFDLYNEDAFTSERFASMQLAGALGRVRRWEAEQALGASEDRLEDAHDWANVEVGEGGEVVERSQVDDYVWRHDQLAGKCLYMFAARYYVTKRRKVATSTRSLRQFGFDENHPAAKSHCLATYEQTRIPVLQGPSVPKRDHPEPSIRERYARSVLVLFKPWRTLSDLRSDGESWEDALRGFVPPDEARVFIDNLQLLHAMDAEGAKDRAAHEALGDDGRRNRSSNAGGEDFEAPDSDLDAEADSDLVGGVLTADISMGDSWVRDALDIFQGHGVFDLTRTVGDSERRQASHVALFDSDAVDSLSGWRSTLKTQDSALAERRRELGIGTCAEGRTGNPGQTSPDETPGEGAVPLSDNGSIFDLTHPLNPVRFAMGRSLNRKQTLGFVLVAVTALQQEGLLPSPEVPAQTFIAGAAGSGKSVVLHAVADWMTQRQRRGNLRLTAPTGTAAAAIKGMTIHTLFGIGRRKEAVEGVTDRLEGGPLPFKVTAAVRKELESVHLILCDEVGMVGHNAVHAMHQVLTTVKQNTYAFGKTSLVFFGDFCQFAPIGDAPLYDFPTTPKTGPPAPNLWRQEIQDCIVLDEPMRQGADEIEFLRALRLLRVGEQVNETFGILNNRVVGSHEGAVTLRDPIFKEARFITPRHSLHREVNKRRAEAFASERNSRMFVSVPIYYGARLPTVMDLKELRMAPPNKHGGCDPVIQLVIGMPVVVNTNLHTSQGVTNGAYGTLTKIFLDPEDAARLASTSTPSSVPFVLSRPPPLVIVRMRTPHPDLASLPGLEPGEVPIVPHCSAARPGKVAFSFRQLPLSPAFAVTNYRAQGATEKAVVIDLQPPEKSSSDNKDIRSAAYVPVSRVTTLEGLAILRDFVPEDLGFGVKAALQHQLRREQRLEQSTLERLDETIADLGWADTLKEYFRSRNSG